MRIFYLLIILLYTNILVAQSFTISGYVIDEESGETLIGANIVILNELKGASTDGNGYFTITGISTGNYTLEVSYIGYENNTKKITLENKSIVLPEISLQAKPLETEVVVVTAERTQVADIELETSHFKMTPKAVNVIPNSRGDVFRALKYLPGVGGVDPVSPLFSARGSDPGENMVLLDGVTIYNPYHFVSASGLFNLYAIKNIELMVGGFGAEYGGRNSSVLYLTTREGNNKKLHGELETGISQSRIILDFPVGKNATMMISGRTYYNMANRFFFNSPSYFYDMNVALNWKINPYNRLSLRYFNAKDYFDYSLKRYSHYLTTTFDTDLFDDYDAIYKNNWKNQAATAILKTIINPKLYLQTQVAGSFFSSKNKSFIDFEYTDEDTGDKTKIFYSTKLKNKIKDLNFKTALNYKFNSSNTFKIGAEYNHYFFNNNIQINYLNQQTSSRKPDLKAAFFEDKITMSRLLLRPGVRFSKYSLSDDWYYEPRINGVLDLPGSYKVKAAYGKYYQYIISINSQEYELSQFLDNYYPLKDKKPSASTHYIFGIEKQLSKNSHLSLDMYYKDLSRVYTFDSHLSTIEASQFPDKLRQGNGKSYGMEILWKGNYQKFSGWVSYGLSKSTRSYSHIMNGKEFYFDYDRTHSFKAVVNHQIRPGLSYSGTLQIMSGVPKTLERSIKSYYYFDPATNDMATQSVFVSDSKNNARMPFIINLDLGLKKRIRKGFAAELADFLGAKESFLNVSLGNLSFLRRNVWIYLPMGEKKYYGFGMNWVPSFGVGYTIKF